MKKSYSTLYIGVVILFLAAVGCREDDKYILGADRAFITVLNPEVKSMQTDHQAKTEFCIVRSNARWKAGSDCEWLACRTTAGEFSDSLFFTMTANRSDKRIGHIVMQTTVGNEACDTLTVIQSHFPSFRPEGYSVAIRSGLPATLPSALSSELSFQVAAEYDWKVFCRPEDTWITLLTKENTGTENAYLAVKANDRLENRKAYVYVSLKEYTSVCDSLLITQAGRPYRAKITVPRSKTMMLDEQVSAFSFSVEGDGKWKVTTDAPEWVTLSRTEYTDHAEVGVEVSATTSLRKARIMVSLLSDATVGDTLYLTQDVIPKGRLKDSLALVALYYATNGANWTASWKLEEPLDKWYGVFMDNGRVIDLSLGSNNLEGTLPEELGWLTEIIKIKFYSNKLSGPIPAGFNKLTKLTHIFMSKNKLSGQIPDLSALQELEELDLTFNRIEGFIPAELTLLPKLPYIKISYNRLDPSGCIPAKYAPYKEVHVNPQRAVYGDKTTDYNLSDCE